MDDDGQENGPRRSPFHSSPHTSSTSSPANVSPPPLLPSIEFPTDTLLYRLRTRVYSLVALAPQSRPER
jgi:hypothetical protein